MTRQRSVGPFWSLGGVTSIVALALAGAARGEQPPTPDVALRQLLQANPITAPYNVMTSFKNGQVVLSGAVGTKQIHDIAIRLAIASGYPIRDDLVINTALAHRVAAAQAQAQLQAQAAAPGAGGGTMAPSLGYGIGNLPYVYPPPLFGRIDDPFFGFEPPILSYPPWWRAVVQRETGGGLAGAGAGANGGLAAGNTATVDPAQPVQIPLGPNPSDGVIEMTIDPRGCAVLRGMVPSLTDKIAIGQKIAQTPGVTEVLNLLQIGVKSSGDIPPTPPQPGLVPPPPRFLPRWVQGQPHPRRLPSLLSRTPPQGPHSRPSWSTAER
jgi:hypothetical protein